MTTDADPTWTVAEAAEWFTDSDLPISEDQLRQLIRALRIQAAGARPSGPGGGRGVPLYSMTELMKLHAAVAEWIAPV